MTEIACPGIAGVLRRREVAHEAVRGKERISPARGRFDRITAQDGPRRQPNRAEVGADRMAVFSDPTPIAVAKLRFRHVHDAAVLFLPRHDTAQRANASGFGRVGTVRRLPQARQPDRLAAAGGSAATPSCGGRDPAVVTTTGRGGVGGDTRGGKTPPATCFASPNLCCLSDCLRRKALELLAAVRRTV